MDNAHTITIRVPLTLKKRGGRKLIITPGGIEAKGRTETSGDPSLVKAVARAFRWRGLLESGAFATIQELAAAEKINPSYVSRMLRLTLLAPEMVETILDGRQPEGLTLPALLEGVPVGWGEQRAACAGAPQ
ncbi:MAG: hypothetical protein IOD03_22370 [Methylocystis sp.]|nr:hypothetical protein [Methylocystis sp.]